MPEIVYIDRSYIQTYGTKPRNLPDDLAEKFIKMGVARLVKESNFNPQIAIKPQVTTNKIQDIVVDKHYMYDFVTVFGNIPQEFIAESDNLGFFLVDYRHCDVKHCLLTDYIVVQSDFENFNDPEGKKLLNICLFQRGITYQTIITKPFIDEKWGEQLVAMAKVNHFSTKELAQKYRSKLRYLINPYRVGLEAHKFFRQFDLVVV